MAALKPVNRIESIEKENGNVLVTVDSSFIVRLGYNAKSQALLVEMKGGRSYVYSGCTRERFKKIATADSIGKAYNELVKEADLPCDKLSDDTLWD